MGATLAAGAARCRRDDRHPDPPSWGDMRLLFVCLGNICRSPTAEGVMRDLLAREDADHGIELDSAATGDWHAGEPPDPRAATAAHGRGVELSGAARQVRAEDFRHFDLLLAMDRDNARALLSLAPDERGAARVRLLREYDPRAHGDLDVPDPYMGGEQGFEHVLDLVTAACQGLLAELQARRRT